MITNERIDTIRDMLDCDVYTDDIAARDLALLLAEIDRLTAELVQRGMEIDALKYEKADAVKAFHDATRLRSEIQKARIKAEDERDAAIAYVCGRVAELARERDARPDISPESANAVVDWWDSDNAPSTADVCAAIATLRAHAARATKGGE